MGKSLGGFSQVALTEQTVSERPFACRMVFQRQWELFIRVSRNSDIALSSPVP